MIIGIGHAGSQSHQAHNNSRRDEKNKPKTNTDQMQLPERVRLVNAPQYLSDINIPPHD